MSFNRLDFALIFSRARMFMTPGRSPFTGPRSAQNELHRERVFESICNCRLANEYEVILIESCSYRSYHTNRFKANPTCGYRVQARIRRNSVERPPIDTQQPYLCAMAHSYYSSQSSWLQIRPGGAEVGPTSGSGALVRPGSNRPTN